MAAVHNIPGFTDTDRLGLTVFASILVHMIIILGVTFSAPRVRVPGLESLEITLVQTRSDKAPATPQFLAQASQDGGGKSDQPDIARSPLPLLEMSETANRMPVAEPAPQRPVSSIQELASLLTGIDLRKVRTTDPKPEKKEARTEPERAGLPERPTPRQERARLNAEISRSWQEYQRLPRHKYLNARTQEYKWAAYMDAWRAKVERVGNLNYPEEAKRQGIAGSLVLDVALNPDGTVHAISVRRPSGHKFLDDAAVRIVELAAPFAPLPSDLRAEAEILHITRTWKFSESVLTSGND